LIFCGADLAYLSVNETLRARWRMASECCLMLLMTPLHRKLR